MEHLIIALVTTVLAAIGAAVRRWLQTQLTPARLGTLRHLTSIVVGAAEELGAHGTLTGPEKYQYAEQGLIAAARRVGIRIDRETANALIHAVLYDIRATEVQLQQFNFGVPIQDVQDAEQVKATEGDAQQLTLV